jgi:signal transduction histidine kinase
VTATSPERDREYRIIEEQAALRRMTMLVVRAVSPEPVFTAVAEEIGQLVPSADFVLVGRYDADRAVDVVGGWERTGRRGLPDLWASLGRTDLRALVSGRDQLVRLEAARRCYVGTQISVDDQPWGLMVVASACDGVLPEGTERQLAGFAELVAAAIAGTQARMELRSFAEEQAALRRVATLVARGSPPEEVLAAVTDEAGRLLNADFAVLSRYDADGLATVVGQWVSSDESDGFSPDAARDWESRPSVAVPIWTEGRLWGAMSVGSRSWPLPSGTEARLAGFTELAATAIANAEAQAALSASRVRIVAAADQARRRIERNLHDGAQQRLVSLALQLRAAQGAAPPEAGELAGRLEGAVREATEVLEELREIGRGLHPAILSETGLRPALRALARRSAIPVDIDIRVLGRLPEQIEVSGYYVVAEALTNTSKHARASAVRVEVEMAGDALRVAVQDDGTGGADLTGGTGLAGLKDRVEALGGRFVLDSPPGAGTTVQVEFPLVTAAADHNH